MTALNRVLIPVDVSESPSVSGALVNALPPADVILLGYWLIPHQTTSEQARTQFGAEGQQTLQSVADQITDYGLGVQTELVFAHDRSQLIDRATNKYNCQSVLIPGSESPSTDTPRGLVLVKPDADLDRIATTIGTLFEETDTEFTLFHVAGDSVDQPYDTTEYLLRGMKSRLTELGLDKDRISWKRSMAYNRVDAILSEGSDYDFVILSESEPTLRERIFGPVQSELAKNTQKPLLTVRVRE